VSPPDWNLKIVETRLGRKEMLAEFGMEGRKREREKRPKTGWPLETFTFLI
jgi:hypothetical protein